MCHLTRQFTEAESSAPKRKQRKTERETEGGTFNVTISLQECFFGCLLPAEKKKTQWVWISPWLLLLLLLWTLFSSSQSGCVGFKCVGSQLRRRINWHRLGIYTLRSEPLLLWGWERETRERERGREEVWCGICVFFYSTCDSLPVNQKKANSTLVFFTLTFVKLSDLCVPVKASVFLHDNDCIQHIHCTVVQSIWKKASRRCFFIAKACALQRYSHSIWVKTFTANVSGDPSQHISAKSWPNEAFPNTCAHMWPLWYCPASSGHGRS